MEGIVSKLFKYASFLAGSLSQEQTVTHRWPFFLTPTAIGGKKDHTNRCFLTAADWVQTNMLFMDVLEDLKHPSILKRHANSVLKTLSDMGGPDEEYPLLLRCRKYVEHRGNARLPATLYHQDGRTASGTVRDLEIATGLPQHHVRDVVNGTRRHRNGWFASRSESMRGRLKPGRKPRPQFIVSEGTPLF